MKKIIIFILLISHFTFSDSRVALEDKLPHLGSDVIDVQKYSVNFDINEIGTDILSSVKINLKAKVNINDFGLHIDHRRYSIHKVSGKNILKFELVQGRKGKHGLSGQVLKIFLKNSILKGESVHFKIEYTLKSKEFYSKKGVMFSSDYFGSRILNVRSWPYYTRFWLPSNDHPSDVASFEYEFKIPEGMMAAANGEQLIKQKLINKQLYYRFSQDKPIPTYGTNWVVGNLLKVEDFICYDLGELTNESVNCALAQKKVPFSYIYSLKRNIKSFVRQIKKSVKALIFYSNLFSDYSFSELNFVIAPHPFNMESVNLITLVSPAAAVHEVLHMWWGNTVYFDHWGDFWISEGLTTYFTGYYDEVMTGKNTSCMQIRGILNHGPDTDPMDIFNNVPYCKGAAAIHDLRKTMMNLLGFDLESEEGMNFFNNVMRDFYQNFRFKRINSEILIEYFRLSMTTWAKEYSKKNIPQVVVDEAIEQWKSSWFQL